MGTTWFPTGVDTQLRDKNRTQRKTTTYTVTAADNATSFVSKATTVYTLPSTLSGLLYTFVNEGKDGICQISVSPAAADGINGAGVTTVINKDIINTLATSKKGDYILIAAGAGAAGVTAWSVVAQRGIWAKEA